MAPNSRSRPAAARLALALAAATAVLAALVPTAVATPETARFVASEDPADDPHGCVARLFSGQDGGPNALPTVVTNVFFVKVAVQFPTLEGDELCGLESAMRAFGRQQLEYPNITVCVFLLTTSDFIPPGTVDAMQQLYGMKLHVLLWEDYMARWRAAGTLPHMMQWFDGGQWKEGFVLNNLSNGMRLVLLYNHGGAYFDLDIVHLRAPRNLTNFISWQKTNNLLNNAALGFQRHFGYMEMASKRFAENFKGKIWGNNGPNRLTATWTEFCNATARARTAAAGAPLPAWCSEMQLLPPQAYYPVYYQDRIQLYSEVAGRKVSIGGDTYGTHLWKAMKNKASIVEVDSVFHKLARQVCPQTLIDIGLAGLSPSRLAKSGKQTLPEALNATARAVRPSRTRPQRLTPVRQQ